MARLGGGAIILLSLLAAAPLPASHPPHEAASLGNIPFDSPASGGQAQGERDRQEKQADLPPGWENEVASEVNGFYREYWQAWENKNLSGVSRSLAGDYILLSYVPGQGPVQVGKPAAVESVRQFFAAIKGQQVGWQRSILSVLPRSLNDAVVIVRSDFYWGDSGGHTELSLEVVRKGSGGRWEIVRQTYERSAR